MDIKKFEKIISDLSNLRKENIINDDINKYRNSPLIKDLNLTDKEFISFGAVIKQIVDENEKCKNTPNDCPLSSKYHLKLIRDKNNLIKIVSEMCEKYRRVNIIKPNYLIRDFSSSDLNKTMNDLIIENDNESKKQLFKLFTRCIEQFKNNEQSYNRGIFLYGYMGVGKTFWTIVLANELAYLGKTICFVKTTSLGFKLKGNLGKGEESDTDQIIDDLKKCDVLFLDDMAAEYTKSGWFYIEPLFIVLDYRMQHNKLTFFSSNLKLSDYQDRLSGTDKTLSLNLKRLVERIKALTNNISFELKGKNKRY